MRKERRGVKKRRGEREKERERRHLKIECPGNMLPPSL